MALRIEKTACIVIAAAALAGAEDMAFPAHHEHLHKSGTGSLWFTGDGVRWEEAGKTHDHSRTWKYEEIERLELAPDHVRVVTYEDIRWQFGRDREYLFDHLPVEMSARLYPFLIAKLDQRFLAHVADPGLTPLFEAPAKLLLGNGGSNGRLKIGEDRVTFDGGDRGASRTWRYSDIANVSSSGPFDLTFATLEGENRLELKNALTPERYNELWRRISESNGLKTYGSQVAHSH